MPGTVTVACKMPGGVILNLDKYDTAAQGQIPQRISGGFVTLKGNAINRDPSKIESMPRLVGGYAFTEIDADFWDAWVKSHADSPLLKDRLIFAQPKAENAESKAKAQAEVPAMFPPAPRKVQGVDPAAPGAAE